METPCSERAAFILFVSGGLLSVHLSASLIEAATSRFERIPRFHVRFIELSRVSSTPAEGWWRNRLSIRSASSAVREVVDPRRERGGRATRGREKKGQDEGASTGAGELRQSRGTREGRREGLSGCV